jgi:hypothetical protein
MMSRNTPTVVGFVALLASTMSAATALAKSNDEGRQDRRAEAVTPLFGLARPSEGPFPSDRFTVEDKTQNTCERVHLPRDCSLPLDPVPSDCLETDILNQLDGFNIRPRLSIPFSGDLDLSTVDHESIYIVKLGNALVDNAPACGTPSDGDGEDDDVIPAADAGWVVGIDQGVWDPDTQTLHVEAAEVLDQHTRYVLFVTTKVKDATGRPIEASKAFKRAIGDDEDDDSRSPDPREAAYRAALRRAVAQSRSFGLRRHDIAAATVFTTMSVTSVLEKIRAQIAATPASLPNFKIARAGPSAAAPCDASPSAPCSRALFDLSTLTGLTYNRQVSVDRTQPLSKLTISGRLAQLRLVPGAVAQIAFATYPSPYYLGPDGVLPFVGTYSGIPKVQKTEDAAMAVFIPSGSKPRDGWPVIIFGHGGSGNILTETPNVGAQFAAQGFATVVFNLATAGFGPNTSLTLTRTDGGSMTVPLPGRTIDVDGEERRGVPNGKIDAGTFLGVSGSEGYFHAPPATIYLQQNTYRQSAIHVMQLVHMLKAGVDIDGDGTVDLDGSRLYYCGVSGGGHVGMVLFPLEPDLRAAAFSSIGGWPRLWEAPAFRGATIGTYLKSHLPNLLNAPGVTSIDGVPVVEPLFNENLPSRGKPVLVNNVAGAIPIQQKFEQFKWLSNVGQPGPYAVYLRLKPLARVPPRPFLMQVALGDRTVPNDFTYEMVQAGNLADRVTLFRHDEFVKTDDALKTKFPNPHGFLIVTTTAKPTSTSKDDLLALAAQQAVVFPAQVQVALFFASDGTITPDPDGDGALFEVPASVIPQGTNFIH